MAATGALALLVVAAFQPVTPLAVGLAAGALVLAAVRAGLTYGANVRMLRASAREALTDALSGLGNRRALMVDLEQAFAGSPPACPCGPWPSSTSTASSATTTASDTRLETRCWPRIGAALAGAIGEQGRAYRLGGDEFCALLDGRRLTGDRVIAAACAALVETGSAFTVTAAVGVAVVPDDASSATAALQLADERMYADKARHSRAQARDVLMQVLDERTPGLLAHVSGVSALSGEVAAALGLDAEAQDEILRAAELHDIGKLAIPDAIIDKPGRLDESEWAFMRQHPVIGERILGAAPALAPVAKLVRSSHERWDGGGYPDGLAGEQIPLGARIVFACDAYDAMTTDRCYQQARTPQAALDELRRHAGTQFDPRVVEALCARLSPQPPAIVAADPGRRSLAPASAVPRSGGRP